MVPVLNEQLTICSSELLLLDSDIRVLDTGPEESPAGQSGGSIKRRSLVNAGEVTVPDNSLAGKESVLVFIKDHLASKVVVGRELNHGATRDLGEFLVVMIIIILGKGRVDLLVELKELSILGVKGTAGGSLKSTGTSSSG